MEEEKQSKTVLKEVKEATEKIMSEILMEGIQDSNIGFLDKIVDIHKDISKEEFMEKEKEEKEMKYRAGGSMGAYNEGGNYGRGSYNDGGSMGGYSEGGSYGRRGVPGSGRGRYSEGSYGRRGVKGTGRGRYRGEEMMEEMMFHYGNYSEGGQYGAEGETMEALSNLMESAYEYFKDLKENANSQDEIKMMEHYFKKMGQM